MPPLIILVGPTAVGKTDLAVRLALELNGEILSADSMQIYKGMDIGTAKPSFDERKGIPHHLIDLVSPDEAFTVADFQTHYQRKLSELQEKNLTALLSGGTGLYVRAVTRGFDFPDPPGDPHLRDELRQKAAAEGNQALHQWLAKVDPISAEKIHPNDLKRVLRALEVYIKTGIPFSHQQKTRTSELPANTIYIGITREREELYKRIELRVDKMLTAGLLEEVQGLLEKGYGPELQSMQGLGYKELIPVLTGDSSLEDAVALLKKRTRHYAKRQLTWFRREPVEQWFLLQKGGEEETFQKILKYLEGRIHQVSNKEIEKKSRNFSQS